MLQILTVWTSVFHKSLNTNICLVSSKLKRWFSVHSEQCQSPLTLTTVGRRLRLAKPTVGGVSSLCKTESLNFSQAASLNADCGKLSRLLWILPLPLVVLAKS